MANVNVRSREPRSLVRSSWKMFELMEPRKRRSRKTRFIIKIYWRH